MRSAVFFLFLFLTISNVFAQTSSEKLIPYRIKNKWGLMNLNDSLVVPVKYKSTYPLIYSRARIKQGQKYGYADVQGNIAIPPKFDSAADFTFGYKAKVKIKDRQLYIDSVGNEIHPMMPIDNNYGDYDCGNRIFRQNGMLGLDNFDLDTILQAEYAEIIVDRYCKIIFLRKPEGKFGAIDYFGNKLMDFSIDSVLFGKEHHPQFYYIFKNGKVGALNILGQLVADIKYTNLESYN